MLNRITIIATMTAKNSAGSSKSNGLAAIRRLLPEMNDTMRKGQCGKVGIVGGSVEYTGAPYFAAITGLKLGADLVHVFCTKEAAPVIKGYSPDLIVHPSWQLDTLEKWIDRFDSIGLGSGLGRSDDLKEMVNGLMKMVRERDIPIVIDGDGLFAIGQNIEAVKGYKNAILTPNFVEFERLYKTVIGDKEIDEKDLKSGDAVKRLADAMGGVTIMQKGGRDLISNGHEVMVSDADGSPRRCGGQGDLCAGATATFANWAKKRKSETFLEACLAGSHLTRLCANLAYEKHGRSMVTADMINEIETVIKEIAL